jgi:methyl farnesoate epoxidase/farnesoate epoxidase
VDEIAVLINRLRDQNQQPVDIKDMTLTATTNIISGMIFNERLGHDDPNVRKLCDLLTKFNDAFSEFTVLDRMLPRFVLRLFGIDHRVKLAAELTVLEDFIAGKVADHRKNYDAANPRDFVDMYLSKQDLEIGKGFYDTIIAFTADATHSVATLMQWIALYLGHHPEVQRKIQAEVDQVVGPSQMVSN